MTSTASGIPPPNNMVGAPAIIDGVDVTHVMVHEFACLPGIIGGNNCSSVVDVCHDEGEAAVVVNDALAISGALNIGEAKAIGEAQNNSATQHSLK